MNAIVQCIRRMSNGTEAGIVMLVAFGWFIFISTVSMLVRLGDGYGWGEVTTADGFNYMLLFEALILFITFLFLWCRGWSWQDLNLDFSFRTIIDAVILLVGLMIFLGVLLRAIEWIGLYSTPPSTESTVSGRIELYEWLPAIIVNSLYEEFFLLCYLFKRLDKSSMFTVIGLSTLIRVSYHTYQGPAGWISLLVLGLVMATYYNKTRNLTVPILVHTLWNFLVVSRAIFFS